ncbi:hypothetical protein AB0333_16220 [Citricoccus sp. NPDC079358]|uniref:hypothetical protein n=1 Tax=Citricoccus sp. NPDC079358 TaxID=3154653 RepID=UPI00344E9F40
MKHETKIRWGPGLATVAIGAAGIATDSFTPSAGGNAPAIGIYTVILAGILVVAAHAREWTKFAWFPLVGFAIATVGNVIGNDGLAFGGAFLAVAMAVQHSIQEQRRSRKSPAQSVAHG